MAVIARESMLGQVADPDPFQGGMLGLSTIIPASIGMLEMAR